ncbi:NTE family protein rssA [Rhodomicrobium udaipurense JA643]|uniref:Patatin-like phospholipase family protein n=1 Tax=Rhodomicrobium udaipurense TaxID=1202716 RepID=A0A8I1KIE9_9HYPH|nr:patatin-like phospholipase family protein [Rhodomicrobium udaipurense]KAI93663.1 NTE family protein rssA [Rhodomicrobium udaipurense JA643]MBJ7542562.1 patatin-like phospholipase family protein [Rhodomicrobium udaipurense]
MRKAQVGLALGGGAARGLAHIGVLEVLIEAGFEPDIVAGTSIGAVAGGYYAAGQLSDLKSFAREMTMRKLIRYLDVNLAGSSLVSGKRLEKTLASHIGDLHIEELPKKFAAIATELGTGQEVWLTKGSLAAALRASYALPGIFKPVRIGGRWLMDGALVNPVPVTAARAMGAHFVIAVTLHSGHYVRNTLYPIEAEASFDQRPERAEVDEPTRKSRFALVRRQVWGGGGGRKRDRDASPGIPRVVLEAFNITQNRIARSRLAGDPPDATIQVHLDGIGLFDFHKAEQAIEQGRLAAQRYLASLRREGVERPSISA